MSIKNLLTENQKNYLDLNVDTLNTNTINSENLYLPFSYIDQSYVSNPTITTTTPLTFVNFTLFPNVPANSFFDISFVYDQISDQNCCIFVQMNNLSNDENSKCVLQVHEIFEGNCSLRFRNYTAALDTSTHVSFMVLILTQSGN